MSAVRSPRCRSARRACVVALGFVLGLGLSGCGDGDGERQVEGAACAPADNRLLCGAPLLFAHRGGGKLRPEETLPAYANAAALGADVLEADLHSTADGEVVCMHDAEVDRTTDGKGPLHALSLSELKTLDAGYHFSTDGGGTFPQRGKGVTVPTLGELLDAHPEAWWTLEIKQLSPSIVDAVVALLDAKGATSRWEPWK